MFERMNARILLISLLLLAALPGCDNAPQEPPRPIVEPDRGAR